MCFLHAAFISLSLICWSPKQKKNKQKKPVSNEHRQSLSSPERGWRSLFSAFWEVMLPVALAVIPRLCCSPPYLCSDIYLQTPQPVCADGHHSPPMALTMAGWPSLSSCQVSFRAARVQSSLSQHSSSCLLLVLTSGASLFLQECFPCRCTTCLSSTSPRMPLYPSNP